MEMVDGIVGCDETYSSKCFIRTSNSDVIEIPSSLLHPLTLAPAVVVFVENTRRHVRAVTDNLFRNIVVQMVSDPTTPESVRTDA